jgi:hypothetical protein
MIERVPPGQFRAALPASQLDPPKTIPLPTPFQPLHFPLCSGLTKRMQAAIKSIKDITKSV